MGIEDTREWKQSIKMRPACNRVLREVFKIGDDKIIRFEQDVGPHILDSEFAIDLKVKTPCGAQLSGQEKALSHQFHKYKTFTMEFYQNRHTKEPGEFFKIASQFYLSGYSDVRGDEFAEWHIFKMFDMICWLKGFSTIALEKKTRPSGGSRACFLPIRYEKIPDSLFFASGEGPARTKVFECVRNIVKR